MLKHFYITLLLAASLYAVWRGRRDERIGAAICVIATLLTVVSAHTLNIRYARMEPSELAIDVTALLAFVGLALGSLRFWPLWTAGLQLTTTTAHILKSVDEGMMRSVYAAAERVWSYPILIILIVATWRGSRAAAVRDPTPA